MRAEFTEDRYNTETQAQAQTLPVPVQQQLLYLDQPPSSVAYPALHQIGNISFTSRV